MISDVGDVDGAIFIQRNAMRLTEFCPCSRTAVAGKPLLPCPGNRSDYLRFGVDAPDDVIPHFDENHISVGIEADFVGFVQLGVGRRTTVARVTAASAACDGTYVSGFQVESTDSVISNFRDV